jgi:hypothetical protein
VGELSPNCLVDLSDRKPKILQTVPDFAAKEGLVSAELRPTEVRSSSKTFLQLSSASGPLAEAFPSSVTNCENFSRSTMIALDGAGCISRSKVVAWRYAKKLGLERLGAK